MNNQLDKNKRKHIDEFVDRYFNLPQRHNNHKAEDAYLIRKYGKKTHQKYIKLGIKDWKQGTEESNKRLTDFVFETGLCEDDWSVSYRSRETLRILLYNLSEQQKQQSTLLDVGSGDGRIAIGLALYLDNLSKIHTLDRSLAAHKRTNININKLDSEDQKKVKQKIIPLIGDFNEYDFYKQFTSKEPEGVDIALASYPLHSWGEIVPALNKLIKNNGRIITCYDAHQINDGSMEDSAREIIEGYNIYANGQGFTFDLLGHFKKLESLAIIASGNRFFQ
tara:strand:- start:70 stop:903 length:834 start_codon:yes stop_codon:yes gene_type:complete